MRSGILITVEGIDGSGKSTLVKALHEHLISNNINAMVTKEPGATPLGKQLRAILQTQPMPVDPKAEFLMFAADRAQHIRDIIKPALAQGNIIISDRMADSSVVYQGYGRGLNIPAIESVNKWVMDGVQPDITIYLRISIEEAERRLTKRAVEKTAFEKEKREFTQRLIDGFEALFAQRDNIITIDAEQPADTLATQTSETVLSWINKNQ